MKHKAFYWFTNALTPILTWMVIAIPFVLSIKYPFATAYALIALYTFFLYKGIEFCYQAYVSYRIIMRTKDAFFEEEVEKFLPRRLSHFILMPNYKEPIHKIKQSIESLLQHESTLYDKYLVLAFEEREHEAKDKEQELREIFKGAFKDILATYHVMQPGEIVGKASNQAYAARAITAYCRQKGIQSEDALVTVMDADSKLPANYFSYLSFKYLTDKDGKYHFFWAPVLLYNNFWKLAFFVRMQATLSSIRQLAILEHGEYLIQASTYTAPLWLLEEVNYWDTDIIPEDWHIHLQAFFKFGEKVRTVPMYTLVSVDAVEAPNLKKTILNRYDQERRWAWGVTDVGYSIRQSFKAKHIPLYARVKKVLFILVNHLRWPTMFFLLVFAAFVPSIINAAFAKTTIGFLLPRIASAFLTVGSVLLAVYLYLDVRVRSELKIHTPLRKYPLLVAQWLFMPIVSFFFSSLPALEAHTRLLIGKHIEYKVTEKM